MTRYFIANIEGFKQNLTDWCPNFYCDTNSNINVSRSG